MITCNFADISEHAFACFQDCRPVTRGLQLNDKRKYWIPIAQVLKALLQLLYKNQYQAGTLPLPQLVSNISITLVL